MLYENAQKAFLEGYEGVLILVLMDNALWEDGGEPFYTIGVLILVLMDNALWARSGWCLDI